MRRRAGSPPSPPAGGIRVGSKPVGPLSAGVSTTSGPLFENAVVSEAVKHRFNKAERRIDLMFFRDRRGFEVDLLYPTSSGFAAIEIKSGRTIASDWFGPPRRLAESLPQVTDQAVVYSGDELQQRKGAAAVPLTGFADLLAGYDA